VFSTVGRAMVRSHSSAVERTEIVKNQLSIIEDPFFSMRANHSLLESGRMPPSSFLGELARLLAQGV